MIQANAPGWYPLTIRYYERKNTWTIRFYWLPPGGEPGSLPLVPAEVLAHLEQAAGLKGAGKGPRSIRQRAKRKRMEGGDRDAACHAKSEQALRIGLILTHAEQTFGSKAKADAWLRRPTLALGGRRPRDLLDCKAGRRIWVEQLLHGIDHGILT